MATIDYFQRKLDEKRRLTIPAELRSELKVALLLPAALKYLHLYPKSVMGQAGRAQASRGDILSEEVADLNVQFEWAS